MEFHFKKEKNFFAVKEKIRGQTTLGQLRDIFHALDSEQSTTAPSASVEYGFLYRACGQLYREWVKGEAPVIAGYLHAFAKARGRDAERQLRELAEYLPNNITVDVLEDLIEPSFQETLRTAARHVIHSHVVDYRGHDWGIPWNGDYVDVAVSQEGDIMGAVTSETMKFNDKALANAIMKALSVMLLEKTGRMGGLHTIDNLLYLESLGFIATKNYYLGAANKSIGIDGTRVYFAAGACHTKLREREYISLLLGRAIPKIDTLASRSEEIFCEKAIDIFLKIRAGKTITDEDLRIFEDLFMTDVRVSS